MQFMHLLFMFRLVRKSLNMYKSSQHINRRWEH